ncbi:hypothetical protein PCH_Pc24g01540 [Penicillium rubens Wisconsin 54-1255]|uniref:F-box domain-containing protein n=1 Tax=Penicillium rubens (strain ATCC 28089 / DSM 1075 / NRRL 1951 / Wisconsin 54-1255) TaxID=500485 RepID=B6HWU5_PENRW|nr:hypothetical protein PCH_Pc24g01540 [Penicillium rubens Wisconsin 54-1255]
MNLKLVPEQISWGRAFANSREPAKMLKILGNSPRSLNTGIVDIEVRPVPVAIGPKEKPVKDLGDMRSLPNELVDMIVNTLDLPSAIRLSYVNRVAHHFTQIRMNWNILELKEAIIRENCVVCGEACVQLYLPTMERICHPCVHDNHAYWCLPVQQAAIIFGLGLPDLIDTQTMYLPQLSKVDLDFGDLGAWVVPIKLALTKALELYGTRKGVKRAAEGNSPIADKDEKYDNPDDEEFVVENRRDIYRAATLH